MNRREYLVRTGVVCAAGGLAGCGLLGGGDGNESDDESDGSDSSEGDGDGTDATETATSQGLPETLQTAVQAKAAAVDTYRTASEEFQNIDTAGTYYPQDRRIDGHLSEMRSALEQVGANKQGEKVALGTLGDYIEQATGSLERRQPAVRNLAEVVGRLVDSGPADVRLEGTLEQTEDAGAALANMALTFDRLESDLNGISANENVLPESELETLISTHSSARTQIGDLQTLQEGLVTHIEGIQAHQAAAEDINSGQEAGEQGNIEDAREAFRAGREKYNTAEERLRTAKSTLSTTTPGTTQSLADRLSLLECRAGAVADASQALAAATTATLDRNQELVQQKQAEAAEALRRCSSGDS